MTRLFAAILFAGITFTSCSDEKPAPSVATNNSLPEGKTMDSITAEILKARDFQGKGDDAAALRIAESMIEKYPGQIDALTIKAEILKEQGRTDEALAIMEKALSLKPNDKETAYNLAYEYADAKNQKALALTDTLIKYDKSATVARAWYSKATYYNNVGNEKEALRYYDSSIIADYNLLDTYLDKGQLQFKQKNYEAALKTFATGQKLGPGEANFYFWVGRTQEAMGDKQNAKANYERAYVLDKSMTDAKEAAEKLQ